MTFEEDHRQGKDRPVLLVERDDRWLLAVMPSPIEPLTAEPLFLPAAPGAGTMPTLPAILLSLGSLAMLYM